MIQTKLFVFCNKYALPNVGTESKGKMVFILQMSVSGSLEIIQPNLLPDEWAGTHRGRHRE